jgi:hypothetical protein
MTDQEFLECFESCSLDKEDFHHNNHVRLAWIYLRRFPALEALSRFSEGLKRFARSLGKEGLYHETITWGYMLLIRERIARSPMEESWEEFARANPDILNWRESVLKLYYRDETLKSDLARRVFVFPDKQG